MRMHEPILAKPVGPMLVRLQRWAQRNPGLATAVGGLFAVLTVGLAVALFLLGQRDRALSAERDDGSQKRRNGAHARRPPPSPTTTASATSRGCRSSSPRPTSSGPPNPRRSPR